MCGCSQFVGGEACSRHRAVCEGFAILRGVWPLATNAPLWCRSMTGFGSRSRSGKSERHVLASGAELVDDWVMALRAKTSVNRTLRLTMDWAHRAEFIDVRVRTVDKRQARKLPCGSSR